MSELSEALSTTFIAGVAAGVVSSILVAVIWKVVRAAAEQVVQYFKRRIAEEQLTDLSGTWRSGEVDDPERPYKYKEVIKLKQKGMAIKGIMEYTQLSKAPAVAPEFKTFNIIGIYRERSLSAYYISTDRRSVSSGCIAVQLKTDNSLEGGCAYYAGDTGKIEKDNIKYNRDI